MTDFILPDLIDNRNDAHRLSHILNRLLVEGASVRIATGYFNLAGFTLIRDGLTRAARVQLLLGKEPLPTPTSAAPDAQSITDELDADLQSTSGAGTRDAHERIRAFVEFLRDPRVEVKLYTARFLHAKAYIIEGVAPFGAIAIVGSSNLTHAGLTQNTELNMVQKQAGIAREFSEWFTRAWDEGAEHKAQLVALYESAVNLHPPFLIYLKSLYEALKDQFGADIGAEGARPSPISLADFQRDGYHVAKDILETYGGVLIADSVGFGKTYLALKLLDDYAYQLRQKALVVCPAQLRDLWWNPKLRAYNIRADIVSQEQVSQSDFLAHTPNDYDLVVVDESHNFRNPIAQRFGNLLTLLTRGKTKKVILLTATPINTSVFDLYHQIRFITRDADDYLAGTGLTSLKQHFIQAEDNPDLLADVLETLAVRRSREFIRKNYPNAEIDGKRVRFPERQLHSVQYNLQQTYEGLYDDAARVIEGLYLAPYLLDFYRKDVPRQYRLWESEGLDFSAVPPEVAWQLGRQASLVQIMRTLYLKRLESSVAALKISFERQRRFQQQFLEQLRAGKLLTAKDFQKLESLTRLLDDEDIEGNGQTEGEETTLRVNELLAQLTPIDASQYDLAAIAQAIEHDLRLLDDIVQKLAPLTAAQDDKLDALKARLVELRHKKVVVFSYFKDTARYVYKNLREDTTFLQRLGHTRLSLCDGGVDADSRRDRVIRFAPKAYEHPEIKGTEREIDVLISTDVLSEGQNLQDADTVINYDLHWNPVRMVQRAGRVDRLGSDYDVVHIYNFVPEDALESLIELMKRLRDRLEAINRAGLLDASVLGEVPTPREFGVLRKIAQADKSVLAELEAESELDVGDFLKQELLDFINQVGKERLEKIPLGAGSAKRAPDGRRGLFVHLRGGAQHFLLFYDLMRDRWIERRLEIMRLVRCAEGEAVVPPDFDIYPIIERAKRRVVTRLRQAKVRLPRLQSPQNHIVNWLRTHQKEVSSATLTYYNDPLPDPYLRRLRKIWNQARDNPDVLLTALENFAHDNPITKTERPDIPELTENDLSLVCYMAMV